MDKKLNSQDENIAQEIINKKRAGSKKPIIFALSANIELGQKIAEKAKLDFEKAKISKFLDGELLIDVQSGVRRRDVFIIQSTSYPTSENIMELFLLVDSLRRASAKEITVCMPYYGYSRQDRRLKGRQPISAKMLADLYETLGIDRIITFDLHSAQIEGFFKIPIDNLKASGILIKRFNKVYKKPLKNLVIVSPDHGGINRARHISEHIGVPMAVVYKKRTGINKVETDFILGDVKGKDVVFIDDIVDTGNTIIKATNLVKSFGAKDIYLLATHPVFSKKKEDEKTVIQKFIDVGIKKIITTNSINIIDEKKYKEHLFICDLSDTLADIIKAHLSGNSITQYFYKNYKIEI